jgi:transcriptional regulator with PAS, ATPase and Fis domain
MNSQATKSDYGLVGESAVMRMLNRQIRMAARCDLTVLISGESGTGKELVARAIHLQSSRAKKPFVSLNCGTLTETLLESELFGYERGAFTGAHHNKKGLFEAAHTGTIFLDEIGEMSPSSQVKLLRVLQESAFRPVGGHLEISVDVRVIAATNRDLAQETATGRFRSDLFYRIAVLTINTPALRSRPSDIPILIQYFLDQAQKKLTRSQKHKIEDHAIAMLSTYGWPGNVRQLRHVVDRLVATASKGATITVDDIHAALPGTALTATSEIPLIYHENESLDQFLDRVTLQLYGQLLAKTGSHTKTARILRTDRVSLYQRIERARERLQLA